MNKRNVNIDLIKCIACFGVVGLHSVGMVNYTIYYLCGLGVPLFFMVNGYLMFSKEQLNYSYAFRKTGNLFRIVILWNLLITLPILIFRHKFVNPLQLCLESLFQKGYLWHFWFFGTLMILYLLLPIFHKLLKDRLALHAGICLCLLCICLAVSILSIYRGYSLQLFVPQTLRLWSWLFFFLFGGLCANIPAFSSNTCRIPLFVHGALVLVFTIVSNIAQKKTGLYLIHNRLADLFYDDLLSILWYVLLFTFLLRIRLNKKVSSPIIRFSSLTMGIFILHPILLAGTDSFFTPVSTFSAVLFWIFLTAVSGIGSFLLLKIPYIRALVKL